MLLAKQTRHEASRESIHAVAWLWLATCHYAPSKSWCQVDFGLWWPIDLTRDPPLALFFLFLFSRYALRYIISCKLLNYLITTTWSSPRTLNLLDELQSTLASSWEKLKSRCLHSTRCSLLSAVSSLHSPVFCVFCVSRVPHALYRVHIKNKTTRTEMTAGVQKHNYRYT